MLMGEEDIHNENIKRKITLIKEKLVTNTLNNNVPWVNRLWCTHEGWQNEVNIWVNLNKESQIILNNLRFQTKHYATKSSNSEARTF